MADRSPIEWCDSTFNPWIGCTKVSPACENCYAESMMAARMGRVTWGVGQPRSRTSTANWRKPLQWNVRPFFECTTHRWRGEKGEIQLGVDCPHRRPDETCSVVPARRRIFCASLADIFDNEVDPQWRADLLWLIDATPNLDWLLLTKRIGNVERMLADIRDSEPSSTRWSRLNDWISGRRPWPNVWLGATICNREEMLRDAVKLQAVPARIRFWSVEPMLGDLGIIPLECTPDWIIAGGESGPHARPAHPDWFRSLRDQCIAAGAPFLFKQWGEWLPVEADGDLPVMALDGSERCLPGTVAFDTSFSDCVMARAGKRPAGRLLDGREHNGFPVSERST